MPTDTATDSGVTRLLTIMARLRATDGCPWDREQDFASIAPHTLEVAHEVADAIARADWAGLKDELGDLLFQVAYNAQMTAPSPVWAFAAQSPMSVLGQGTCRHLASDPGTAAVA